MSRSGGEEELGMLRESWRGLTCEESVRFRSFCGAAPPEASRQVVNGASRRRKKFFPSATRSDGSALRRRRSLAGG